MWKRSCIFVAVELKFFSPCFAQGNDARFTLSLFGPMTKPASIIPLGFDVIGQ